MPRPRSTSFSEFLFQYAIILLNPGTTDKPVGAAGTVVSPGMVTDIGVAGTYALGLLPSVAFIWK